MKITIKNTDEQVELVKAFASRDRNVAYEAQQTFAEFMGRVLAEVVNQAPILANFYSRLSYNSGDTPSIPVDLFSDVTDMNYISTWSQQPGGGLGTNELRPPSQEMYLATYTINSAHSFDRKYAAQSRMDVVGKCMTRMLSEILYKQENFAVGPVMNALANASTNGLQHVFRSSAADRFIPEDFFNLELRMKRINTSFIKGTPVGNVGSITDLLMSPEMIKELRSMAYQPINTAAAPYTSAIKDSIPAPESIREELFRNAGISSFFGKTIHEFLEFGTGTDKRFNAVFGRAADSTNYTTFAGSGSAAFDASTTELILGIDRSRDGLIRLVETDTEANSEFVMSPDDQFQVYNRSNRKVGFYGDMTEGRTVLETRALAGLLI